MRTLLIAGLLLYLPQWALAQKPSEDISYKIYKLERVIDGDTIVASGKKIRLWGIDTPEENEPQFLVAKMLLGSLISKGELSCKFVAQDRYKRDVMHCLIDRLDVGSMMVRAGMARDYKKYSGNYYSYEEGIAKSEKIGIWRDSRERDQDIGHETAICSMDARQCLDGSYVSRQGEKCEFAPCP